MGLLVETELWAARWWPERSEAAEVDLDDQVELAVRAIEQLPAAKIHEA